MPEPTRNTSYSVQGRKSSFAAPGGKPQLTGGTATSPSLHAVLHQLTQSLTVLSNAAELVHDERALTLGAQPLRVWLQPNARQAEASLHRLREFRLAQIPATTDLIQCLTVLVLAADMLIQGHLSDTGTAETYDLLRRNADRAMKSLHLLREHMLGADQA
jgi:hypothetical protein